MVIIKKKKILIIAPFALTPKGTVQSRIVPISKILENKGYKIDILIPPFDNASYSKKIIRLSNNIKIINLSVHETIDDIKLNLKFLINSFFLILSLYKFIIRNKNNYNLIYVFKPKGLSGLAAQLLILLKKDYYLDTDDWEGDGGWNDKAIYSSFFKNIFKYQEKFLLKKAKTVTVASRALETICLSLGVKKESLFYLPNGYEVLGNNSFVGKENLKTKTISLIKKELLIKNDDIVFLYYSRFFEFSINETIKYLSTIFEQGKKNKLLIIGKGFNNEESIIVKGLSRYKNRFHYLGWQTPDMIRKYFTICDVGLYFFDDNLINRTKCPAKLVEMLSYGIPVVGSNVGQIKEFIVNGKTGFVFDNYEEYCELLKNINQNRIDIKDLKNESKVISAEKLSMKKYVDQIFS